jgi:hypothetical protein
MRMAAPRRADLPGHRRHLATQLFKLVNTVVMGLIGGENRRHHHLLMSRVLLLMFECMFDMSQSTPAHRQTSSGSLTSKLGCAGKPPTRATTRSGVALERLSHRVLDVTAVTHCC